MLIKAISEHSYIIDKINRKSKARYAKPYQIGDEITFETTIVRTTSNGDNGGNLVVRYTLFKNGQDIATITQNELVDVFNIFEVHTESENNQ